MIFLGFCSWKQSVVTKSFPCPRFSVSEECDMDEFGDWCKHLRREPPLGCYPSTRGDVFALSSPQLGRLLAYVGKAEKFCCGFWEITNGIWKYLWCSRKSLQPGNHFFMNSPKNHALYETSLPFHHEILNLPVCAGTKDAGHVGSHPCSAPLTLSTLPACSGFWFSSNESIALGDL